MKKYFVVLSLTIFVHSSIFSAELASPVKQSKFQFVRTGEEQTVLSAEEEEGAIKRTIQVIRVSTLAGKASYLGTVTTMSGDISQESSRITIASLSSPKSIFSSLAARYAQQQQK